MSVHYVLKSIQEVGISLIHTLFYSALAAWFPFSEIDYRTRGLLWT